MTKLTEQLNYLAKKAKTTGLTDEEKVLQQQLRNEYREQFKANMRAQLDNTYIVDDKGNKTKVGPKSTNIKQ